MNTTFRDGPPPANAVRDFPFPEIFRAETSNGLQLISIRRPNVPLVVLRYVTFAGAHFDPSTRPGLATMTGALLDEGTALRSSVEIAEQVERLGAGVDSAADWTSCSISFAGPIRDTAFGIELLSEMVTQPAFAEDEIERVRRRRQAELERQRSDPSHLAARAFARALYGERTYGAPILGTPESVDLTSTSDCTNFWQAHRGGLRPFFVATGDVSPDELLERVEQTVGACPADPSPRPQLVEPTPSARIEVHLVNRSQATQTELRVGHIGAHRDDPERAAIVLMNSIFGGKFTSRINLNLRERHGFTYGANSHFVDRLGRGPFLISTAVDNEVAGRAVREILSELRRIRNEPVDASELEDSRSYLLGVFPYTLQTLQGLATRLEEIGLYGLTDDYFSTFPERLRAVTAADIQAVARRLLKPKQAVVVAAGPAASLEPQLADLGPVVVHEP